MTPHTTIEPTQNGASDPQTAPQTPPPSPTPPRGPGLGVMAVVVGVFSVALIAGVVMSDRIRAGGEKIWHATFATTADSDTSGTRQYYTCGMHPWVILPHPGDCPICHMELTPIDPAKFSGEVSINPVTVQNMGVRVAEVTSGPVTQQIRTVGTVDYAEPLVRDVNTKIDGWIETLAVDSVGAKVSKDDVLFEVYSPDLYAAQEEYLLALRNQGKVKADFLPQAAESNRQILESARTRLLYYDISPEQIAELEKTGEPAKTMAIRSPFDGVVIEKNAFAGMKIDPGMRVYRIADLSKVWVMATVYEYQLPFVHEGQAATMTLPYLPGQSFEGKVVYVYPYLSEQSREVKVRLEFDNADGTLKPGMFASVQLDSTLDGDRVLAPRSAVIDTGKRQVAFVNLGEGRFEPREVKTGIETEDAKIEILEGLEPGEHVVTSGQFLIDSEARVRESLAKMIQGNSAVAPENAPATTTQPKPVEFTLSADGTTLQQTTCVVSGAELGTMGEPFRHEHDGQTVLFCCEDCIGKFAADPKPFLDAIDAARAAAAVQKTEGAR